MTKRKKFILISLLVLLAIAATVSIVISRKQFRERKTEDLQTAYSLFDSGKREEAIKLLEERYQADKSDKQVASRLASYYFQNKEYDNFTKIADEAKLEDAATYTMRAFIARGNGDYDSALKDYEAAIKANPKSPAVYIDLANMYEVLNQPDKALETLKEGLNYSPKSSALNLLAANAALQLGDKAAAKEYAKKVLEIDKDNQRAKEILSRK